MVKKKTFRKSFIKTYKVWEDLLDKVTLERELPNQELRLVEVIKLSDLNELIKTLIQESQERINEYGDPNTVQTWHDRGKIEVLEKLRSEIK